MGKLLDISGCKFGYLTAIRYVGLYNNRSALWECECKCGNIKIIRLSHLRSGKTLSCGCYDRSESKKTHGMSKLRPYRIWSVMMSRCYNANNNRFDRYGGRGISVCEKWHKFDGFWNDMQSGYSDNLSIDRIDNNGNYEPANCRWATKIEQANNRGTNFIVNYQGKNYTLIELQRLTGIKWCTIRNRIVSGWDVNDAITIKAIDKKDYKRKNGKFTNSKDRVI